MANDIILADGKYRLRRHDTGKMEALRHGEPWRDLVGDNLIGSLASAHDDMREALVKAAALLGAVYEWADRVEKAGGTTTLAGVAAAHAMLNSLKTQAPRVESLVLAPAHVAIASFEEVKP